MEDARGEWDWCVSEQIQRLSKRDGYLESKQAGLVVRLSISDVGTPVRTVISADLKDTSGTRGRKSRDVGTILQCESWLDRPGDPADISRTHLADNPDTGSCDLY